MRNHATPTLPLPDSSRLRATRQGLRVLAVAALAVLVSSVVAFGGEREDVVAAVPGSNWPIVLVRRSGGLRLADDGLLRPLPYVYVTANGRLISPGRSPTVRPAPARPALRVRVLTRRGLERLREFAAEAGIDRTPPAYGRPPVADATTTEIVYRAPSGRTYTHRIYAIGFDSGTSAEQRDARRRARRLIDRLSRPAQSFEETEVGPDRSYTVTALEISAGQQSSVQEPLPGAFPWPLRSVRLAQAQTCTPITGPDATVVRRALRGASAFTRWTDDGHEYVLSTRPVLPGEVPCP